MTRTDRQKPLNYHHLRYFYADDIFTTGRELQETLAGHCVGRPARLTVGMTDALPKLLANRLLEPAMAMPEPHSYAKFMSRKDKCVQLAGTSV